MNKRKIEPMLMLHEIRGVKPMTKWDVFLNRAWRFIKSGGKDRLWLKWRKTNET